MDELSLETYLFISPKNLKINILQKKDFKSLYLKEIEVEVEKEKLDFNVLDDFLENNIFKIERKINKFIKNINLILDNNEFLTVHLSIKRDYYGNALKKEDLSHLLNKAKYECKKTINFRKITHMLIDNYCVDKKNYSSFPENLKCKNFSLDIRFICLSKTYLKEIEKVLKKYQITVSHILNSEYVESFLDQNEKDLFKMSRKIIDGFNENEVTIVPKTTSNKGFFEQFFKFFN